MIAGINRLLDGLVRPEVPLLGRARPAFQVCGFAGLVVAAALTEGLTWQLGLEPWIGGALVVAGALGFLAVAVLGKAVTGSASLVFYRQALAVLAAATGTLVALDRPVLPYLDVSALAVMGFLACGRVGCLMVGCCHGKPAAVGVRYRRAHAIFGFSPHLVGVRLFPTQAIEAVAALALTAGGVTALVIAAPAPGVVMTALAVGYALARFLLEIARGDRFRPILAGFSEAQWISIATVTAVVVLAARGWVPARPWQVGALVAVAALLGFIAAWRYLGQAPRHRLLHPGHIHEVATALAELPARTQPGTITTATTSLGICMSVSSIADAGGPIAHVTISHRDGGLPEENARVIVDLVCDLHPDHPRHELVSGRLGVFHLLFHP